MTTVVASLECMAADERLTSGGPLCHAKKIHRLENVLYGFCGDVDIGFILLEWLATKKRDRELLFKWLPADNRNEIEVMELSDAGLARWTGWGVKVPLKDSSWAIGSGAMSALRAFRDGKPIDDAIRGATELDEGSGILLEVQVEYLLPPELTKVRRKR